MSDQLWELFSYCFVHSVVILQSQSPIDYTQPPILLPSHTIKHRFVVSFWTVLFPETDWVTLDPPAGALAHSTMASCICSSTAGLSNQTGTAGLSRHCPLPILASQPLYMVLIIILSLAHIPFLWYPIFNSLWWLSNTFLSCELCGVFLCLHYACQSWIPQSYLARTPCTVYSPFQVHFSCCTLFHSIHVCSQGPSAFVSVWYEGWDPLPPNKRMSGLCLWHHTT